MRGRSDPLLAPSASKETALRLIRIGVEKKGGAPSAARIAQECLARGFLLSHEERLLLSFALLTGLTRKHEVDAGEASWQLASNALLRQNKPGIVLQYALRIFAAELERQRYPRAYRALERARRPAERLPAGHPGALHYGRCVEEYVYLSNDTEGGARLRLE